MALATSKRKFYKLLDNLSSSKVNASQPQTMSIDSQVQSTQERPIKRPRAPVKELSASAAAKSAARLSSPSIRMLSAPGARVPPVAKRLSTAIGLEESTTYAPWSQEQFLSRLETFADVKIWTTKPDQLNDVAWAKRGWSAVASGLDEASCRTCGKRLLVQLGADQTTDGGDEDGEPHNWWQEDIEQDFVKKYEELIVDGHTADCLWRKAGCKDDIYRIKFSDPGQWQAQLATRYNSLLKTASQLPAQIVVPSSQQDENADATSLKDVAQDFSHLPFLRQPVPESQESKTERPTTDGDGAARSEDTNSTAATMAICGWEARNLASVPIVSCSKCFARVGLWLYTSDQTTTSDSAEADSSMKFDPVTLHRTHCPWQNADYQRGLGSYAGLPAWQILARLVGLETSRVERRKSTRDFKLTVDNYDGNDDAEDQGDDDEDEQSRPLSRASREEIERQDKERETRLEKLKRAFAVKNTIKKNPRPISARSAKSILSTRSLRTQKDD